MEPMTSAQNVIRNEEPLQISFEVFKKGLDPAAGYVIAEKQAGTSGEKELTDFDRLVSVLKKSIQSKHLIYDPSSGKTILVLKLNPNVDSRSLWHALPGDILKNTRVYLYSMRL